MSSKNQSTFRYVNVFNLCLGVGIALLASIFYRDVVQAKGTSQDVGTNAWIMSLNSGLLDNANYIIPSNDGNYIVAGNTQFTNNISSIFAAKVSPNGTLLWYNRYRVQEIDTVNQIKQTSSGGYVLVGSTISASGASDALMLMLDLTGAPLWHSKYGGTSSDSFTTVIPLINGDLVAVGATSSFGSGFSDIWAVRTDSSGTVLWQKAFGGNGTEFARDAIQISDDAIVIVGETQSFASGLFNQIDGWALQINAAGEILWQRVVDFGNIESIFAVDRKSDDTLLLAGTSTGLLGSDGIIIEMNDQGIVTRAQQIDQGFSDDLFDITALPNGDYVAVGTTASLSTSFGDGWILRFDANGALTDQKLVDGGYLDGIDSLFTTSNGQLVMTGQVASITSALSNSWILQTNSDGEIPDCSLCKNGTALSTQKSIRNELSAGNQIDTAVFATNMSATTEPVTPIISLQCNTDAPAEATYIVNGEIVDLVGNAATQATIAFNGGALKATTNSEGAYRLALPEPIVLTVDRMHEGNLFWPSDVRIDIGDSPPKLVLLPRTGDADEDGLQNEWEINGFPAPTGVVVDLAAMGANPLHKDLFIEVDWMRQTSDSPRQTTQYRLSETAIQLVVDAFSAAPVSNPAPLAGNPISGIHLHIDHGPESQLHWGATQTWGTLSRSNAVPYTRLLDLDNNGLEPIRIMNANLGAGRSEIFRYGLMIDGLGATNEDGIFQQVRASGLALWTPGSLFMVALGVTGNSNIPLAGTFMHEFGHTLGLTHGGPAKAGSTLASEEYKPTYLSVMNYSYQFSGLIRDGRGGFLDFSRFDETEITELDEGRLNESLGLNGQTTDARRYGVTYFCPDRQKATIVQATAPINWNCNSNQDGQALIEPEWTSSNINLNNGPGRRAEHPTTPEILRSYDDWANIYYKPYCYNEDRTTIVMCPTERSIENPDSAQGVVTDVTLLQIEEPDFDELWSVLQPAHVVATSPSGIEVVAIPDDILSIPISITNQGSEEGTFALTYQDQSGWFTNNTIPLQVSLVPSQTMVVELGFMVPNNVDSTIEPTFILTATPTTDPVFVASSKIEFDIGVHATFYLATESIIEANAPLSVEFMNDSSGSITEYQWDFGDGNISTEQNPVHTYLQPGVYDVSLAVTNASGFTDTMVRPQLVRVLYPSAVFLPLVFRQ